MSLELKDHQENVVAYLLTRKKCVHEGDKSSTEYCTEKSVTMKSEKRSMGLGAWNPVLYLEDLF